VRYGNYRELGAVEPMSATAPSRDSERPVWPDLAVCVEDKEVAVSIGDLLVVLCG